MHLPVSIIVLVCSRPIFNEPFSVFVCLDIDLLVVRYEAFRSSILRLHLSIRHHLCDSPIHKRLPVLEYVQRCYSIVRCRQRKSHYEVVEGGYSVSEIVSCDALKRYVSNLSPFIPFRASLVNHVQLPVKQLHLLLVCQRDFIEPLDEAFLVVRIIFVDVSMKGFVVELA